MSVDRTLLRFAECWSSHNADEFLSLFTEDCVYEDVAAGRLSNGKAELRAFYEMGFTAIPDHRMDLKSRFATDDRALLEWVVSGTLNMPVKQNAISFRGVSVMELRGELIYRNTDYWDRSTVLKQTGQLAN